MLRVVRVLAPNPRVYTLEGTNTWVVGEDPAVVIDPGPLDPAHLDEVARVAGRVGAVLVTHDHPDHAPGALTFARRVGAPLRAFRLDGAEHLRDGERIERGRDARSWPCTRRGTRATTWSSTCPRTARCSPATRCSGGARASSTRPTATSRSTCGR